jgi:hypothetical protein
MFALQFNTHALWLIPDTVYIIIAVVYYLEGLP